ncbi:hypothetical protein M0R45_018982 [Rubus argutus]|uniref:VIN3-like fibronectin type-III domain-containing protein n=1 Tax=Rubus argutus TaxID=59490 RepID=A0AAW1X4L0_RUBAR
MRVWSGLLNEYLKWQTGSTFRCNIPFIAKPEIQDLDLIAPDMIIFEDICATSLYVILGSEDPTLESLVGYRLWHIVRLKT